MSTPNPSYLGARHDMLALVDGATAVRFDRVLDVGCASGATGEALKASHPDAHVTGIEMDERTAGQAGRCLDRVIVGHAATELEKLADAEERFDLVICGDVLEHLPDPWTALKHVRVLCPAGHALVSLPNVAHFSTIASLLFRSRWPYRDRGICDRTHLRFFGEDNLEELFAAAGFSGVCRQTQHRIIETPHRFNDRTQWLAQVPVIGQLTKYQFISLLR